MREEADAKARQTAMVIGQLKPRGSSCMQHHIALPAAALRGSKFDIRSGDDDTDEAGVVLGAFDCTYMAAVPSSNPSGKETVAACMKFVKVC